MAETARLTRTARGDTNPTQDGAGRYYHETQKRRNHPDPRWRRQLRRFAGRGAQGESLPSFEMAAAVGAVPGSAPRPQPRLPRPSHRPLAVLGPAGGARARRACSWHLTWRQWRQLQRPGGMGAPGAGPEPAKPAARGRRKARGLWPRRTWSSTMW